MVQEIQDAGADAIIACRTICSSGPWRALVSIQDARFRPRQVAFGLGRRRMAMPQKLARHSDPKLTANTYTHLGVFDKAAAIGRLPGLPDPLGPVRKGAAVAGGNGHR